VYNEYAKKHVFIVITVTLIIVDIKYRTFV